MAYPAPPNDRNGFEIAVICATKVEADAVEATFDKDKGPFIVLLLGHDLIDEQHPLFLDHQVQVSSRNPPVLRRKHFQLQPSGRIAPKPLPACTECHANTFRDLFGVAGTLRVPDSAFSPLHRIGPGPRNIDQG